MDVVTSHRFTYRLGASAAVCAGEWAVLVGVPVNHPLVSRLYALLGRTPTMGEITDLLAGSYGEYTDVVVLHATDPVEAFVWGSCGVESTGGRSVGGSPIGTEHRLPGLVGAWLGGVVVPSGEMLPAGLGVFPAGRLETTPVPVPAAAPVAAPPVAPPPPSPVPAAAPGLPSTHLGAVDQSRFSPAGAPIVTSEPSLPTSPEVSIDAPWLPASPSPVVPPPAPADQLYVPDAPPPMSAEEQPTSVDADDGARRLVPLARRCPHGHVNPAYLDSCAVCGERLGGAPFAMPPVSLGKLIVSTGGEVTLDHDVILGRSPRLPAGLAGVPPELVKVTDPSKDVSNTHVFVRVVDQQVLVSDLGSTNGTEVVRPGWPPVPLSVGQEIGVEPGTRIVLAGTVVVTYEA